MIIGISIVGVLLAALLIPLFLTGDLQVFLKRYGLTLAIGFVGVLVAILLNSLAQKASVRTDLTADQKYSVSPGLMNITNKLTDQVQIVYYVSSKIQEFVQIKLDLTDKLNEIKNASKGLIDFKIEDVDQKDEKLMQEMGNHGFLRQIQSNSGDELSFSILISGMKITYKDQESVYIPQIYSTADLEYALGEKLIELYTKDKPSEKPVIAVDLPPSGQGFNMPGRPQQGSGFEWIIDERSGMSISNKKFDLKPIDVSQAQPIPEKTSLLMMIRPRLMDERQKYEVEKYLAEGGKVLIFASPVRALGDTVEQTPFGLEDYFKDIGITFGKSILADKSHLSVSVNKRTYEFPPYFIRIKPDNIDQSTALTRLMPGLCMPTPTEIAIDKGVMDKAKLAYTVLAKTTENNWELKTVGNTLELDKAATTPPAATNPPKTVFAMIKGQFPFPYEGKPVPEWPMSEKDREKEKANEKEKPKAPVMASAGKREGTLIICSSPEAFYAPYLEEPNLRNLIQTGNVSMLLNLTESLSYGDDLIKLRTKHYETRIISKLAGDDKESLRLIWKIALIAAVPGFVLLFSVYRFILRRISQLSYERKFAGSIGPSSFTP